MQFATRGKQLVLPIHGQADTGCRVGFARAYKRISDYLIISLLILVTVERPVQYGQLRPGRHEILFEFMKFRTMREGAGRDSDRLKVIGRVLRCTSLDGLPKLWSASRGRCEGTEYPRFRLPGRDVRFIGIVAQSEVAHVYARADASIMTMKACEMLYRYMAQNKLFDSLAAGKPVFANYIRWASELVDKEDIGRIIPKEDEVGTARAVAAVLEDTPWINRAGETVRRLMAEDFNFDVLAKKMERALVAVADVGRPNHGFESGSARHWADS